MESKSSRLWRTLTQTQFTLTPELGITAALAGLTLLPLFVSATFPLLCADVQETMIDAAVLYIFGNYWRDGVYALGILAGLCALWYWGKTIHRDGLSHPDRHSLRGMPLFLGLMLGWSLLSALCSPSRYISFFGTAYRQEGFLTYLIYACVFASAMLLRDHHLRILAEIMAAGTAAIGILVIGTQQGWELPFYLEDARNAMFHNNNHFGYYLGLTFPISMGLVIGDGKLSPFPRLLRLAEFWLVCNAVAVNAVRGSFLGIAAGVIGWNLVIFCTKREKLFPLIMADFLFLTTVLGLNTGSELAERFGHMAEDLTQAATGDTAALDDIGSGRGEHWRLGFQFIWERPLVGHGPDNLGYRFHDINPSLTDRPHNELLQFAASLGLPALFCYLAALWSHFRAFLRTFRRLSVVELSLFAAIGSYLVGSMFGNTMYYTTPYFYLFLGASYRACREKE